MFAITHDTIVSDFSDTQDMTIFQTGTVHLECTFAEPLEEDIALITLNQFDTYRNINPDGYVLLNLAPWKQIK